MITRIERFLVGTALGLGVLAGVTACSGSGGAAPAATVTSTATVPASSATPRSEPAATSTPAAPGDPAASGTPVASGSGTCTVAHLSGRVGERDDAPAGSGSGMSQQQVAVILTNTGTASCTLQGWPGVSYVGDGNGTQLGAAAALDRTATHPTVTLAPGASAQAPIDFVSVAVFPEDQCRPAHADGIRVYPPGSRASLFIAGGGSGDGDACTLSGVQQMSVGAFVPLT